jgi:hypothetical protein
MLNLQVAEIHIKRQLHVSIESALPLGDLQSLRTTVDFRGDEVHLSH